MVLNSLLNRKKLSYKKKLDSLAKIKFDEVIKEDVDTYPIFKGVCDTATTKSTQKECFEKTFAALFEERLRKDPYEVSEPIKDSVILNIKVDNIGKIVLIDIKANEKTKKITQYRKRKVLKILCALIYQCCLITMPLPLLLKTDKM